ncbi:MAG TPA: 3'-5' exonuclease, partial [Terriglobales bacterium]|nr:3'-5' exonuclease [Terriglobales bacterium]
VSIGFPPQHRSEKAAFAQLLDDLRHDSAAERLQSALVALDDLPPLEFDEGQWKIAEALFRVLPAAVRHLQQVFADQGAVDFPAVTEAARRVLDREAPAQTGIRHLLVDEYQDTSVTQQELLEALVRGWRDGDGCTVFLVGDPMQSIYSFRQAEVGLYLEMQQRRQFGRLTLEFLRLEQNFRSGAGIVQWVNRAFAQIFPQHESSDTGAVSYAPMRDVRSFAAKVKIHAFFASGDPAEADQAEADCVCDLVGRHRMRDPAARIAILVSARNHIHAIAPKLLARGLRFRAVEIKPLAEVQVVRDLKAITRALLHDCDRIAWLALLRGPCCGVGLQDLEILCGNYDERHACIPELIERRLPCLSPDAQQRISRVKDVMEVAQRRRGRVPLAALVEGTWIALGGPECFSGEALDDAATYFRALAGLERAGEIADWRAVDAQLESLFAAPDPDADGHLQIMTIHKAKGLEFDVVILPQLGRIPKADEEQLLLWRELGRDDGRSELLLAPIKARGSEQDPLYRYLSHLQQQRRAQELKRLLYVAATRARQSLHVLGCAAIDQHGDLCVPDSRSLLAQLWPVVEADFRQRLQEFVPRQSGLFAIAAGAAPGLRRLAAEWTLPAAPASVAPAALLPRAQRQTSTISFEWASEERRATGTVLHAFLQKIASDGLHAWPVARVAAEGRQINIALRAEGIAEALLPAAAAHIERALVATLQDERGLWCLGAHQAAEAELSLAGMVEGKLHSIRIDRTFICDGVRWIVDYKTGTHEGSGKRSFFDNELERYREQLTIYSALLRKFDSSLPVRAGLYFPGSAAWRELPVAQGAAGN